MVEGLVLGSLTFIGFCLLWRRAPQLLKKAVRRAPFLTDLAATVLAYVTLSTISSSLASAIGSAVVGICVSLGLSHEPGRNRADRRAARAENPPG